MTLALRTNLNIVARTFIKKGQGLILNLNEREGMIKILFEFITVDTSELDSALRF
jgi:hypothetical protein